MLPAGFFGIAGPSILLYRFIGVRAIKLPWKTNCVLFEVGLKVTCFAAEHCEHVQNLLNAISVRNRRMPLRLSYTGII